MKIPEAPVGRPVDIDSASFKEVLQTIEQPTADARALYYRWEREQWEASVLDMARDAADWAAFDSNARAALSAALGCVFPPDRRLGSLLVPFVDAVESEEDQVFLTSQLVDEARAIVFAERLRTETGILLEPPGSLDELFAAIERRADEVRVNREEAEALYEGLLLHNIVYEGVIVVTVVEHVGEYLDKTSTLPGLRSGLIAFARDLTRHVHFGTGVVARGVTRDRGSKAGALEEVMERAIPYLRSSLSQFSPGLAALAEDSVDVAERALETFAWRMQDVGLDMPT